MSRLSFFLLGLVCGLALTTLHKSKQSHSGVKQLSTPEPKYDWRRDIAEGLQNDIEQMLYGELTLEQIMRENLEAERNL